MKSRKKRRKENRGSRNYGDLDTRCTLIPSPRKPFHPHPQLLFFLYYLHFHRPVFRYIEGERSSCITAVLFHPDSLFLPMSNPVTPFLPILNPLNSSSPYQIPKLLFFPHIKSRNSFFAISNPVTPLFFYPHLIQQLLFFPHVKSHHFFSFFPHIKSRTPFPPISSPVTPLLPPYQIP